MNWWTTTTRCLRRRSAPRADRGWVPTARLTRLAIPMLAWAALTHAGSAGENLFRRGLLPSGQAVHAERQAGASVEGMSAACVNCHRRSGLGSIEGLISIPPIAGPYLFAPHDKSLEQLGVPYVDTARQEHYPYTDATLAQAIREGIGANGHPLNYLMPRYQLDDAAMADLVAYLKAIPVGSVPGVTKSVLHFATIITPDADPVK